jgi:hypothetical protein
MPRKKQNMTSVIKDSKIDETNIITTEKVKEIIEKESMALPLKRTERLWFNANDGVRRKGIKFAMTQEEIEEYIKCKLSVYYFAEHYCKIKLEDGTIGQMKLRDYQKDIIKLYTENRYSILMASRQIGKCLIFNTLINIKDEYGKIYKVNLGKIYYENIAKYRKLTFLEKIKIFLYNILEKLD